MAQRPDLEKQGRWLALIRRWQRSQTTVTVREFCEQHQVSEASFFSWRRVLRERGLLEEPKTAKASADAPAFVEFAIADAKPIVSFVELVVKQRWLLRVRPGFDADMLLELVHLLEERAC
jgi:phage antirepressor YoqD-like protein